MILSNLARSGGTLISKCLGCMDGVALLSEIHPLGYTVGDMFNPLRQAREWYNVEGTFEEVIEELESKYELIIRDWAHLDFMGVPFLKPYYSKLSDKLKMDEFHLVRHPVPQWLSSKKLPILKDLDLDFYLYGYFRFAERAKNYVKYEDFTLNPEKEMEKICKGLKVTYDPTFINKWPDYTKVTGDGSFEKEIFPSKPVVISKELHKQFLSNEYYIKALDLLEYDDVAH